MAFPGSARGTEHQPLQQRGVTAHSAGFRMLRVVDATPSTSFSACRNGLISDLLLRCGEGDEAAFEAVMDIFYSVVLAARARELPEREVEGAVHGTFAAIWRSAPRYRPGGETAVEWVMGHVVPCAADRQE